MGRTVEELIQEDGVRSALLIEDGIPIYYPTLFVSMELRHISVSRQRSIMYGICVLLNWCQSEGIDLEERFKSDKHLSEMEILRLLDFCEWSASTQRKIMSGVKMLPTAYKQIGRKVASQRIYAVREYLSFLYPRLAKGKNTKKIAKAVNDTITSYRPKIRGYVKNNAVVVTDDQIDAITLKLLPTHPENPWKDPAVQLRNLLIFHLLYETGSRRGEMAALYVSDISDGNVSIYRRHNNPLETRRQAPNAKTGERDIPIPDDLIRLIDLYVMEHRGKIKAAKKHPYLFVSHKKNLGQPLTLGAIAGVVRVAKAAFPELKGLSLHKLRHHMNNRISHMIDEMFKDDKNATPSDKAVADAQIRAYIMGWSPNSRMQENYNKRYNIEKAGKMMRERTEKLNKEKGSAGTKD